MAMLRRSKGRTARSEMTCEEQRARSSELYLLTTIGASCGVQSARARKEACTLSTPQRPDETLSDFPPHLQLSKFGADLF
jgi:hypothetical protein